MLVVVQQAPALTHLKLKHVRLDVIEFVTILKHLGNRLRYFGVSFSDQLGQRKKAKECCVCCGGD